MFGITVANQVFEKQLVSRDTLDGLNQQSGDVLAIRLLGAFLDTAQSALSDRNHYREERLKCQYLEKLSKLGHLLLQAGDVSDGLVVLGDVLRVRFQKCGLFNEEALSVSIDISLKRMKAGPVSGHGR